VILTTPEAASVGLSHRETEVRSIKSAEAHQDMRGASNGVACGEDGGYLKLVFDGTTQRLVAGGDGLLGRRCDSEHDQNNMPSRAARPMPHIVPPLSMSFIIRISSAQDLFLHPSA